MGTFRLINYNLVNQDQTTITSSSEDPNFPSSNIKAETRSKEWRSSGNFIINQFNNRLDFVEESGYRIDSAHQEFSINQSNDTLDFSVNGIVLSATVEHGLYDLGILLTKVSTAVNLAISTSYAAPTSFNLVVFGSSLVAVMSNSSSGDTSSYPFVYLLGSGLNYYKSIGPTLAMSSSDVSGMTVGSSSKTISATIPTGQVYVPVVNAFVDFQANGFWSVDSKNNKFDFNANGTVLSATIPTGIYPNLAAILTSLTTAVSSVLSSANTGMSFSAILFGGGIAFVMSNASGSTARNYSYLFNSGVNTSNSIKYLFNIASADVSGTTTSGSSKSIVTAANTPLGAILTAQIPNGRYTIADLPNKVRDSIIAASQNVFTVSNLHVSYDAGLQGVTFATALPELRLQVASGHSTGNTLMTSIFNFPNADLKGSQSYSSTGVVYKYDSFSSFIPDGEYKTDELIDQIQMAMKSANSVSQGYVLFNRKTGKWSIGTNSRKLSLISTDLSHSLLKFLGFYLDGGDQNNHLKYNASQIMIHSREWLMFDCKTNNPVDSVVLLWDKIEGINLSPNATLTIQANSTPNFDSPQLSQAMTIDDLTEESTFFLANAVSYRYWRLVIVDSHNNDLYVNLGVLILGQAFLGKAPENGFKKTIQDNSVVYTAKYGNRFVDQYPTQSSISISYNYMRYSDYSKIEQAYLQNGTKLPVYLNVDSLSQVFSSHNFSIYGVFDNKFTGLHVNYDILSAALTVTEVF